MVLNSSIRYIGDSLYVDDVSVDAIVRETGAPVYVYSLKRVLENYRRVRAAFAQLGARMHFSVKSNGSLAILRALRDAGAGFDCVSGGEIHLALAAGAQGKDIVFAGVGKTRAEIEYAVSEGVGWFNVENVLELRYISEAAERLPASRSYAWRPG